MAISFKSEEERSQAINEITTDFDDAPVGISHEEFMDQNERKLDEIMSAEIVEDDPGTDDSSGGDELGDQQSDQEAGVQPEGDQQVEPKPDAGEPPAKDPTEMEWLENRNKALKEQNEEIASNFSNELSVLKDEIARLKSGSKEPSPEGKEEEALPVDSEISTIQKEIDDLETYMNRDDLDRYDEEYQKKQTKLSLNISKLNRLMNKRSEEIILKQKDEIRELKQVQKAERDSEKKDQNKKKIIKSIEKFRGSIPELKGREYEQMDDDYTEFAKELATIWYGVPLNELKKNQFDIAVNQYMKGNPSLHERCKLKGLKAPQDLEKYIVLSDVNWLRNGYVLDKSNGQWSRLKDPNGNNIVFPDMEAAWSYYKRNNNLPEKLVVDKTNESAKQVVNALSKRADIVELDEDHKSGSVNGMSKEAAENVLNKYPEEYIGMKARKNFDHPEVKEYNEALGILGEAQLTKEDFE